MLVSTQIDKMQRNVKKLQGSRISNEKLIHAIRIPLYLCIGLLLIIVLFCIYFAYALHVVDAPVYLQTSSISSHDVSDLKNRFLQQLQYAHHNAIQTKNSKLFIADHKLFTRTKTIQYLYDYVAAATKEIYVDQYASNPDYHHIQCIETFTPALRKRLTEFEVAVEQFLNGKGTLFSQNLIKTLVKRDKISEENDGGLKSLIGQFGIISTQNIDQNTCIGQYYGDEYLLDEFDAQFPWNTYGKMKQHPFNSKWDYYMTLPYQQFADNRLGLKQLNVTMVIDGYHSYNYEDYVKDGGQKLTEKQSKMKENLEVFVNDARRQLYTKRMTQEDLKRKNSEFVYCSVDGILLSFLITTKDVKANEQLFAYYGPNYG